MARIRSANGGSGWDAVTDRGGSLVPETERGSLFAHYAFDLSDTTTLYAQFVAGNNKVNSVGTLPLGIAGWAGTVYSGNPYLPANIQQLMTTNNIQSFLLERYHTTADLAHDRFITDNDTRSLTFGADTELQSGVFDGWTLGGYAQLGTNDNRITQVDFIRSDRLPEAMDVVLHPTTGQPVCRASFFDPVRYGNCVPINLLGVGRASQAAIDYVLTGDQYILAETEQNVAEFSMEGDIGDGWGAGAISLAFGGGWREESIDQTLGPDDIIAGSLPLRTMPNAAMRQQHRGPAESAGGLHRRPRRAGAVLGHAERDLHLHERAADRGLVFGLGGVCRIAVAAPLRSSPASSSSI